jgi:1-acyl-sn-glycerol-3-phosphate acyltransferase
MTALRSLVYNAAFYLTLILFLVLGCGFFVTPRAWSMQALKQWGRTSVWLLYVICGTKMEVRGAQHIPQGAGLVAAKHQSTWETFAIIPLFADPAMVLKRELRLIPMFGWFMYKFKMIAVERGAGASAMKAMIADARAALKDNRQILIFPEGTRRPPGAAPEYKPGAAALYGQLGVPCVPMALNSGLFWPRRKFLRYPGTIIVEFLPAIPAGLPRREFAARLEAAIEGATARLEAEAGMAHPAADRHPA